MTPGDVLRYRIAFALSRAVKIVRGLRQGLTEAERYAVADHVIGQLKERGDLRPKKEIFWPKRNSGPSFE